MCGKEFVSSVLTRIGGGVVVVVVVVVVAVVAGFEWCTSGCNVRIPCSLVLGVVSLDVGFVVVDTGPDDDTGSGCTTDRAGSLDWWSLRSGVE